MLTTIENLSSQATLSIRHEAQQVSTVKLVWRLLKRLSRYKSRLCCCGVLHSIVNVWKSAIADKGKKQNKKKKKKASNSNSSETMQLKAPVPNWRKASRYHRLEGKGDTDVHQKPGNQYYSNQSKRNLQAELFPPTALTRQAGQPTCLESESSIPAFYPGSTV